MWGNSLRPAPLRLAVTIADSETHLIASPAAGRTSVYLCVGSEPACKELDWVTIRSEKGLALALVRVLGVHRCPGGKGWHIWWAIGDVILLN